MADPENSSKILVVDDNAENRALARATLEDEGFEVVLAANGTEGIEAFQSKSPDCVLLDVRMPDLDGFSVCSRIRDLPGGAAAPILFFTALRDVDTFDQALRAGGDDFLTKPVRPAELVVRVQAALRLRRMSAELREHYGLVRRQRDDLMRLSLQKERLSSFVIHDLKSPVNSINLGAQVVLADPQLSEGAREAAQHIRNDARSLLRLILNLLDISKSEEGALTAQPVELRLDKLTSEVFDALELNARTAEVRLESALEVTTLRADPGLIRRILENLLENAIRHSPAQGRVRLSAGLREGYVLLAVSDSGVGITPELRHRIFERYVQVEEGERVVTRLGRGLGLAFCKLAIEAHGGAIWVENAGPGAHFYLKLPQ